MSAPLMQVSFASSASPTTGLNEDHIVAVPGLVCLLDGVSVPDGIQTGCVHSTHWYVQKLGAHLLNAYANSPTESLPALLRSAIGAVRDDHAASCDLENPATPASTILALRARSREVDWMVLCDSTLVLDRSGAIEVHTDLRLQRTSSEQRRLAFSLGGLATPGHAEKLLALARSQLRFRNRPDGFWLAGADVEAASHALTGTAPLDGPEKLTRAALLSDGAAAIVDAFGLLDWPGVLNHLDQYGPADLVDRTRCAEALDHSGRNPRPKRYDDASVAFCKFLS